MRAAYRLLLWAVFMWATGLAHAATVERIQVFTGHQHARVLLLTEGEPGRMQSRSSAPFGDAPARGVVLLSGTAAGPALPRVTEVNADDITRVVVTPVGEALQISVEMAQARTVRARSIAAGAVLIDLRAPDAPEDPTLPSITTMLGSLSSAAQARPEPSRARRLVVIDPGHGGKDNGAVAPDGTREADLALAIARRTATGIRERLGAEVMMTRDTDVFIPLRQRAALANDNDAELFLSIHCNAYPTSWAWGVETYSLDTASGEGASRVAARENAILAEQREAGEPDPLLADLLVSGTNRLSKQLAYEVQTSVTEHLSEVYGPSQVKDLGAKTALFYVLTTTRMPSILFESSFITNPTDLEKLRAPHYQQALADALVDAVARWLDGQHGDG